METFLSEVKESAFDLLISISTLTFAEVIMVKVGLAVYLLIHRVKYMYKQFS